MIFTVEERRLFSRLADELIPPASGHLSASRANDGGAWLDAVLAARPDLGAPLKAILAGANDGDAAAVVGKMQADDQPAFGVLAEVAAGAYFMNPDVRKSLGYGGQGPQPIDPKPDYLDDGLLDSVISRGPIYRPTPGATAAEEQARRAARN